MTARVKQLFTYPIKGLTPHECDRILLTPGHGIKGDRAFALMYDDRAPISLTGEVPWMSKQNFAVQNDLPGLAALDCQYNAQTGHLSVKLEGVELLVADTNAQTGRDRIGAFFTGYLASLHPMKSALQLVGSSTGETRYPDRQRVDISLLGQATLDDLSSAASDRTDARRFRPNIVLEGIPAWAEFDWVGREFQLGEARIAIAARINRCVNIEVNPDTGDRDLPLLSLLRQKFGHAQTGILATVLTSGIVAIGDATQLL